MIISERLSEYLKALECDLPEYLDRLEQQALMDEAREVVIEALDRCLSKNMSDWGKIKNTMKDSLSDYLWKKMKRNPMILPIIMEVDA